MIYQLSDKQAENIFMALPGIFSQVRRSFEENSKLLTVDVARKEPDGLLVTICTVSRTAFPDLT